MLDIVAALPEHVRALSHNMREADRHEITCMGLAVHKTLWHSYKFSLMRKTAILDGEVAAMWGCGGMFLGDVGEPWLLTSPIAERVHPLTFVRIYRKEVEIMLKKFPRLVNIVDASYSKAIRLLMLVGFQLSDPEPMGPHGALFIKFEMRG